MAFLPTWGRPGQPARSKDHRPSLPWGSLCLRDSGGLGERCQGAHLRGDADLVLHSGYRQNKGNPRGQLH